MATKQIRIGAGQPQQPQVQRGGQQQQPPPPLPTTRTGPPLPAGTVFKGGVSDMEARALQQVGWKAGQPITPELRAAVADMQNDVTAARRTPPADPTTPAVQLRTRNIADLPLVDQDRYRRAIADVIQGNQPPPPATAGRQASPPQPEPRRVGAAAPLRQGFDPVAAALATEQPFPGKFEPVLRGSEGGGPLKQAEVEYGEPERPATRTEPDPDYAPPRQEEAPPEPAAPPQREDPPEAGVPPMANCPHCGWELARPDVAEPAYGEKIGFLSTNVLGEGKPFVKAYDLMGGHLQLTFRTLTIREVDECFRQATVDRNERGFNEFEWIDTVNRYRLYLQLQRVRSDRADVLLPDGLDPVSSPNAESYWELPQDELHPLRHVANLVLDQVLIGESLCRVAMQASARFNRLVAKLEAMVDDDSFWQATGAQP